MKCRAPWPCKYCFFKGTQTGDYENSVFSMLYGSFLEEEEA